MLVAAATAAAADEVNKDLGAIEKAQLYPENHVLAGNISVPAGLFVRRFLLLHFKEKTSGRFQLRFHKENGTSESVWLPLACRY